VTNGRVSRQRRQNEVLRAEVEQLRADLDSLWVYVFNMQAGIEADREKEAEAAAKNGYARRRHDW
jgi:hypothetical protein